MQQQSHIYLIIVLHLHNLHCIYCVFVLEIHQDRQTHTVILKGKLGAD